MANLESMMLNGEYDKIWSKYCGFLDLSLDEFMSIQERLLMEQIELLSKCELGQKIMGKRNKPATVEEFRKTVPLTTYEDYSSILLNKKEDALPLKPAYWIKTTWKGGTHDIKLAPYTQSMLQEHARALIASLMLATSKKRGDFSLRINDRFLYGMAPLPYLTGLAPYGLENEIHFEYLPPIKKAENISFEERNRLGFEMAMSKGVDLFFGLSSVLVKIGEEFVKGQGGRKHIVRPANLRMLYKLAGAFIKRTFRHETILPRDLWDIKGILCAGTDTRNFKDRIEYYWGKRPVEIYGGTETATVATETWGDSGLTFFPDVNFLEFIPERDSLKSSKIDGYTPATILLDELKPNERYELVTTKYKGGAFIRYKVGDIIECVSLRNEAYGINLPQIRFVDRISNVIDLAGFTRITKSTVDSAITLSGLPVTDWTACKEYENKEPVLHIYLELESTDMDLRLVKQKLHESLKKIDADYRDIECLLGRNPLTVTFLKPGDFDGYKRRTGSSPDKMNPDKTVLENLLCHRKEDKY